MENQAVAPAVVRTRLYHAYSLWLFTFSDLKTIVGPKTAFGVCSGLCADIFGLPSKPFWLVLRRIPLVLLWTWLNLLPFTIDNQRQHLAIEEDRINKPWRPMPSGRLARQEAKQLVLVLYPFAILISLWLGGLRQCVILIGLGFWYNDLRGADKNPVIRNLINACGFLCYASGAMEVAYGEALRPVSNSVLVRWLGIIGAIVLSSVHSQDMYDQAGDSIRGRNTVPLVIGDWPSRLIIALAVFFWSCVGPWFWQVNRFAGVTLIGFGAVVSLRTMQMRSVGDDKKTFRLWNLWLVAFYCLPFIKSISSRRS